MARILRCKRQLAFGAITAAIGGVLLSAIPAQGGFVLSLYGNGPVTPPAGDAYPGYSDYVVEALNTGGAGANSTGSTLLAIDLSINTGTASASAMAVDIEQTGATTAPLYTANVDGKHAIPTTGLFNGGLDAGFQPAFGDTVGGTFIGIGSRAFDPTFAKRVTNTSQTFFVSDTSTGYTRASYSNVNLSQLDPVFTNGASVHAEDIKNGNLHNIEVVSVDFGGGPVDNVTPIPVANILIPTGQSFAVDAELGGEIGPAVNATLSLINGNLSTTNDSPPATSTTTTTNTNSTSTSTTPDLPPPPGGYTNMAPLGQLHNPAGADDSIGLSMNRAGAPAQINNIRFFGQSGAVKGEIEYNGLPNAATTLDILLKFTSRAGALSNTDPAANPTVMSDILHYLDASGGPNYASIVSSSVAANLSSYDVMVTAPNPGFSGAYFPFDFSKFTDAQIPAGDLAVTDIALVPEPGSLSLLVLGSVGLARRRRGMT